MTIRPADVLNSLLPISRQAIEVIDATYEPDDADSCMLLKCKAQVIGGEFDGHPLEIEMTLEGCGEMDGQRHFAALRRAIGIPNPETTDDLRFTPFNVQIGVAHGRNVIRDYGDWGA
ncbi:hypothetical protein [Bosea sp. 2RAB26]|uniref:hypothetical protein n=1 Tax=Bosea sp. 2RAB26 TaxID=3237476 RepID=UPI003F93B116